MVPSGASAARVNIKCIKSKDDKSMRFVFATLYGKGKGEQVKYDRWARLATGDELSTSLQRVEPNTIFETTLCQYALSYGSSIVEWSVEFIGPQILCNDNALNLNTGDQYGLITLRTGDIGCNTEENKLSPTVKFDTFVAYYSPKYATINMNTMETLGDIDIANNQKVYNLDLEYEFDQKLSASKNIIKFSLYDDLLYESLYEGNFYQLFDSNKQLISSGEAFEETAKIPKQKGYVLKLQLRSPSQKLLEKAKNAVLRIDTILAAKQCVSADIYSSKLGILQGSGKISGAITMPPNTNKDLFIVTPSTKALGMNENS